MIGHAVRDACVAGPAVAAWVEGKAVRCGCCRGERARIRGEDDGLNAVAYAELGEDAGDVRELRNCESDGRKERTDGLTSSPHQREKSRPRA